MACSCTSGKGNTGFPSCLPTNEIPVGLLFQNTYDSNGAKNYLDGAQIGTIGYLTGLTQSLDESVRLYPFQDVAEGVSERSDSTFYTDSLAVNHFLKEGERSFVGEKLTNASPQLVDKLSSFKCNQMSVYIVGHLGGIFGVSTVADQLEGYEIVKNTMDAKWVFMTAAKPAHIPMTFTMSDSFTDGQIQKFEKSQMGDSAKGLVGLMDINATIDGAVTVSAFTIDVFTEYGSLSALTGVENLVLADFLMTETSPAPGVTTITSTALVSASKYLVTVTTSSADVNVLTLSAAGYAKGYEMTPLTITTP